MSDREFDIVLFGATGFVGRVAAAYFAAHAPEGLRWALAARSGDKLAALKETQGLSVPTLVADGGDSSAMSALAQRARVVMSVAGPFARYSDKLVEACVHNGTDYVDITGETPWVASLIERFHERAASSGTRIVPLCGFDSVPSDLGTLVLVRWIREQWSQGTKRVLAGFALTGGINGGSLATALDLGEKGAAALSDELLLNPPEHRSEEERKQSPDRRGVEWSPELGRWLAPFVMGRINTRVVRRSNALLEAWGEGYGQGALFTYDEGMEMRSRMAALGMSTVLAVADRALQTGAGRKVIARLGPAPGEGPSQESIDKGFFRARLVGWAADGRRALCTFSAQGDAGNRNTARMCCEAALLLATSPRDALPGGASRGGVLTPASALGMPYAERLRASGMTLTVETLPPPV